MMRLGVAYTVFDGEELLEQSVKQIRSAVDYVVVVYQTTSNFGTPHPGGLPDLLCDLVSRKLIDVMVPYIPKIKQNPWDNEIRKRNLGLSYCRDAGCDYFMSMDVDEYYLPFQFQNAKYWIGENDLDNTVCRMWTYYGDSCHRLKERESYYVSFIAKIYQKRQFILDAPSWLTVDHTRSYGENQRFLEPCCIEMCHMSWIRKDMRLKLENSSARQNFRKDIDEMVRRYEEWVPGQPAYLFGKEYQLVEVPDRFGVVA